MKPDPTTCPEPITGDQSSAPDIRLAARLDEQSAELRAVQSELDLLRKAVRHDVRGHLMNISGYAELLRDHSHAQFDDKARQYLERIINCTDKIIQALAEIPAAPRVATTPLSGAAVPRSETIFRNPLLP